MLKPYTERTGANAVHLKVDLGVTHPNNHVDVELWFSTLVDFPDSLLQGMNDYHKLLGNDVSFMPRISTFSCLDCPPDIKERDCLSNAKYCPFKPNHDSFPDEKNFGKGFTQWDFEGRKILLQALRYKCQWEELCKENRNSCPYEFFHSLSL